MPPASQLGHLQPWLLLALHTLFCAGGVLSQLQATKDGQAVSEQVAVLLEKQLSGDDVDLGHAKRLGGEVLRAALQTQLGLFFAANLAAGVYAGACLATKALFVGQLTANENSELAERLLKFVALKAVLLATAAPQYGDILQWLAWTAVMCYSSMFVKLASLRGDALLSSPSASLAQHCRILALLGGILAQDATWIWRYALALGDGSLSHALLWLFDAVHVMLDASLSLAKYAVLAVDHHRSAAAEARGQELEAWEGRSALLYWLDLASDLALGTLVLAHQLHVWWLHGLQMQWADGALFLEVRYMAGTLAVRLRSHLRYRRLQHQLHHSFPDAPPQQLAEDPCPICLETMKAGKQLPCSHAVHVSCLCAWLQQSRASSPTCPLCRAQLDILPHQQARTGAVQAAERRWACHPQQAPAAGSAVPRPPDQQTASALAGRDSCGRRRIDWSRRPDQHAAGGSGTRGAAIRDWPGPPAVLAVPLGAASASSGTDPARRSTRRSTRLAAAAAGAAGTAVTSAGASHRYPTRHRRRIDGILD